MHTGYVNNGFFTGAFRNIEKPQSDELMFMSVSIPQVFLTPKQSMIYVFQVANFAVLRNVGDLVYRYLVLI